MTRRRWCRKWLPPFPHLPISTSLFSFSSSSSFLIYSPFLPFLISPYPHLCFPSHPLLLSSYILPSSLSSSPHIHLSFLLLLLFFFSPIFSLPPFPHLLKSTSLFSFSFSFSSSFLILYILLSSLSSSPHIHLSFLLLTLFFFPHTVYSPFLPFLISPYPPLISPSPSPCLLLPLPSSPRSRSSIVSFLI